ncbi:TonB-dependent receptor [Asticcacaulis sp. EMRT-3]|uniref:TonB-dependent receptor n=1 Tax=Asticcacaulis sp. EMRT-3 TaxID=3040349 RepID=UPI0024AFCD53|nr:TonB-dependent receptor [Asticcacaulis sp. EMRT-3]MDI7774755.1 TonB-dependent receptor [Asticcacaulis sp. EMRT-3]
MFHTKRATWLLTTTAATLVFTLGSAAAAQGASQPQAANASNKNIETVVVVGTRDQARLIKRHADTLIDIAPLEQIRSLPDANAAEALQRLPGISMESDSGAGRYINIRGMDADLNGTTFDGVRMMANNPQTPQGGARAVAFDAFPAGILGGLEVIKSLTPDMDAEGLGGVVNIQPRSIPVGKDHVFDATLGGGVESLRNTSVFKGDITVGKRFLDGKLSIIGSYAYFKDERGIDDVEADYINDPTVVPSGTSAFLTQKAFDDVQYRWYQYHRTRQGYGAGITYDVSDHTQVYLRGFHAGYVETANKHEFILNGLADNIVSVDNATGNFTSNGVSAQYSNINTREKLGNDLIELGGNTLLGGTVKADARLSWTEGTDQFPYSVNARFIDPTNVDVTYNNTNAKRPTYQVLGGVNVFDPSLYTKLKKGNSPSKNTDQEYAGNVNFSMPLDLVGENGALKFGANVRERTRKQQDYAADFAISTISLSDYVSGSDITYYNGSYNIGPQPIYEKLLTIPQTPITADPSTYEDDNENIYAAYVQYNTSFEKLDVVGGVRIETTDGTYRANDVDADGNFLARHDTAHKYTNFFPDLSLKYNYSDAIQIRAAFSSAIARPGFNQITAARSIDAFNATPVITQGNPDLKPTLGHNLDLSAIYYLPHNGVASIGLFYKSFDNYIIANNTIGATDVAGFVGQKVNLISYANVGSAKAQGIEMSYDQQFVFLPGALSGLGVEGNLTYVESRGDIRPGESHTLPQTSPFTYNAAVFYNRGPLYLKLAASYVSTNLWAVGGDASTDIYSQPRFRLDFGSTYAVTNHVQLYFDAKNISNTHLDFTQTKNKNFPVQNEFYDADYLFGLRVKY